MFLFRRMFFFLAINFLIIMTASVLAFMVMGALGIKGEWPFYIILYSILGFGGAFVHLAMSRFFAKRFMGVQVIDPKRAYGKEQELLEMVYDMATRARLPARPEVGIFDNPRPNAFATGPSKKKSLVAVSTGLLNSTNKQELEGVIAHEVAHIANGDMITMTLLLGLINTMVLLAARFVARIIASQMRNDSYWMEFAIFMGLQVVFSILGMIVLNFFSRAREYRADKDGARLSGADNMILALKSLQRSTSFAGAGGNFSVNRGGQAESYNYLQISGKAKTSLFSTHPPLEHRIARLEKLFLR